MNALIYIEYLKQLNEIYEDIRGFVNNSLFNKGAYEQIKKIIIDTEILNNQQSADTELDGIISNTIEGLLYLA